MGLARWVFNDWFTAHELDKVDARLAEFQNQAELENEDLDQDIVALRADVERLALLCTSLADLCVDRGVLSRDELKAKMLELDQSDGRVDGRLDSRRPRQDGA